MLGTSIGIAAAASRRQMPTYDELVAELAPAGYWKLDETVGTTAIDSSGNSRNGLYVGGVSYADPGLTVARKNGAKFTDANNNTENGVTVADDAVWSMSAGGTWAYWFRTPTPTFFKFAMSRWDDVNDGWFLWMDNVNNLEISFRNTVGGVYSLIGPAAYGDDARHSVVITCDAAKLTTMYVDGMSVASSTATHFPGSAATGKLRINHDWEFINASQWMARVMLSPGIVATPEQVVALHMAGIS